MQKQGQKWAGGEKETERRQPGLHRGNADGGRLNRSRTLPQLGLRVSTRSSWRVRTLGARALDDFFHFVRDVDPAIVGATGGRKKRPSTRDEI